MKPTTETTTINTISKAAILTLLNVEDHSIWKDFWAESEYDDLGSIVFGLRDNRPERQGDYNYRMNLAIAKLRKAGFNAHRLGYKNPLIAHGIVYQPGVAEAAIAPQTEVTDGIYRADCTSAVWNEFIQRIDSGEIVQIDAAMAERFYNILPPRTIGATFQWLESGGCIQTQATDFTFAEGGNRPIMFWSTYRREFFCRKMPIDALQIR